MQNARIEPKAWEHMQTDAVAKWATLAFSVI